MQILIYRIDRNRRYTYRSGAA